ncbi:hypothetical protein NDU88_006098 [Pleurodeles waltl]|uniref:Uncharacterized protein n=1 Tax=Pleurodeles waltl TaxID=8319 RepID=A0AAV7UK02_PLEWA|nr:hypothetical protein NDU88_006098 [Pleurodeles waltl]
MRAAGTPQGLPPPCLVVQGRHWPHPLSGSGRSRVYPKSLPGLSRGALASGQQRSDVLVRPQSSSPGIRRSDLRAASRSHRTLPEPLGGLNLLSRCLHCGCHLRELETSGWDIIDDCCGCAE